MTPIIAIRFSGGFWFILASKKRPVTNPKIESSKMEAPINVHAKVGRSSPAVAHFRSDKRKLQGRKIANRSLNSILANVQS